MATELLYVGNSNTIRLTGLQDAVSEAYLNAATVTVTLKDSAAVNVTGETWPVTMTYVTSSNGNYAGTLAAALAITKGKHYTAHVSVTSSGITALYEVPMRAVTRTD